MDNRDLRRFERLLNIWLRELMQQAGTTVREMKNLDMRQADPLDHATAENGRSILLRFRNRENLLIRKIQRSLRDIEEGTYGICEACGEDIGLKRLAARPVAQYCIDCKTNMERIEQLTG